MVKLYVYLKYNCNGYFTLTRGSLSRHAGNLSLSIPTLRRHLRELIRMKWIVVNGKREAFRVIGFIPLSRKLNFISYKSVIFEKNDFRTFRAFIIASVITYLMNYKRRNERRSVQKKGSTSMNLLSPSFYYTLPNSYLSKVLKISISTASEYKQLAESAGFIKVTKHLEKLPVPWKRNALDAFIQAYNLKPQAIRVKKGSYYEQKPDTIESKLLIKTKTNLKKELKKQKNFRYIKKGGIGGG
jgi:hypothetical protein